ncbi:hypothetical protein, partial [Olsenella uli]|uniref:hypothetical protein n=1 Tax=Olsenella uli TaxID=133926 RepID=UPI0024A85167
DQRRCQPRKSQEVAVFLETPLLSTSFWGSAVLTVTMLAHSWNCTSRTSSGLLDSHRVLRGLSFE